MTNIKSINKPRVSIVCVSFNHSEFIEKTLNGFIIQKTTFPFEIIIGDDFSTDGTRKIINEFYSKHIDIIKPIFHNHNIGGINNLITCLNSTSGDYIAYCEGDDYWIDDNKLQKQFDLLESNLDIGLIWTDIDVNDLQENKIINSVFKNKFLPTFNNFEDILINKPFFAPLTWFFRSQYSYLFSGYLDYVDGTFPFIMDMSNISTISFFNEVTGVYSKRMESASNNTNPIKRYKFAKQVFKIQIDYSKKYQVSKEAVDHIYYNHYQSLFHYALIAKDYDFIKNAKFILKNSKNTSTRFMLFISNNQILSSIFRFIFNSNKIINFTRYIIK